MKSRRALLLVLCASFAGAVYLVKNDQRGVPDAFGMHMASSAQPGFEANAGQLDPRVKFTCRGGDYACYLTASGAIIRLVYQDDTGRRRTQLLQFTLRGSASNLQVMGEGLLPVRSHYLRGNNPERWYPGVASYEKVRYSQVYPGIDLVYYMSRGQVEFDFIVEPGADWTRIQFELTGADTLQIDEAGDLVAKTTAGKVRYHKPVIYQKKPAAKELVPGSYKNQNGLIGFEVGAYDTNLPLIIDPVVSYATYLGGSESDFGKGIAVDQNGFIYVAGTTLSTNFPLANALQPDTNGDFDIFVTKIDPETNTLIYSTYIGGSGVDSANDLELDPNGCVYLAGNTSSRDFPLVNAAQRAYGGGAFDAFVLKLSVLGDSLVYSTFLGGSAEDLANAIAIDGNRQAHITGRTGSTDFPTNTLQQVYGGGISEVFVSKLSQDGATLVYSTYLGDSGSDIGTGIAVDSQGNTVVTGANENGAQGGVDLFVTKIKADGTEVVLTGQIGTTSDDIANDLALDPDDNIYVTGMVAGGPRGEDDAFVLKLAADDASILYPRFLGGTAKDFANRLVVDDMGNAFVVGRTASTDFAEIADAFQTANGGAFDAFVAKLDPMGNVDYASYLGGSGGVILSETGDNGRAIALDAVGNVYVTGHTLSRDFPTRVPFQSNYGGGDTDAFVVRISEMPTTVAPVQTPVGSFALQQNYPNPFNPATTIPFGIKQHSRVTLKVYDALGREVATLVQALLPAGEYTTVFDGSELASGLYVYRLVVGEVVQQRKMVLLK